MKLTKRRLIRLIQESLDVNLDAKPIPYYYITGGCSDKGLMNSKPEYKEFVELVGYVCGFSILENPDPNVIRRYVQVTSGKRNGMSQMKAWLSKMIAGESKEATIALYSKNNPFNDPFMSDQTEASARMAYDRLEAVLAENNMTPAELKKNDALIAPVASFVDSNPFSSHLSGESIDLRVIRGRYSVLVETLDYIRKYQLANFHFQFEKKPPHIHMGPLAPGAPLFTEKGRERLQLFRRMANQQLLKDPSIENVIPQNIVNPPKYVDKAWQLLNKVGIYENDEK